MLSVEGSNKKLGNLEGIFESCKLLEWFVIYFFYVFVIMREFFWIFRRKVCCMKFCVLNIVFNLSSLWEIKIKR